MTRAATGMIHPHYAVTMAHYNQWQNRAMVAAADTLDDAQRSADQGAFFGSIAATCNHLLWGDHIWMSRFSPLPAPEIASIEQSIHMTPDWVSFKKARVDLDTLILDWAHAVGEDYLQGNLSYYSGAAGRQLEKPVALLVVHFFNHQIHHRGQIHAMLTAAGAPTDDTDLPFMPNP